MPSRTIRMIIFAVFAVLLAACTSPQTMPAGLTPIPTLIPVSSPEGGLPITPTPPRVVESFPAGVPAASHGQELYDANCASCHGTDGKGLVPNARNFGDVDYMRGETPVDFYTVISEGRGNEMPAFGDELSSDERWDIVSYLLRFSTPDDSLKQGKQVYESNCVACHGEDGRSMILGAANFSDARFLFNLAPSDMYVIVTQGQGSMPAWQARLNQDQRWSVIDYLRTFSYNPVVSGESSPEPTAPTATVAVRAECAPYQGEQNPFSWDDSEAAATGEGIYTRCASCHGADGAGAIPGVPDFSSPRVQADLRANSGEYFCGVAEGLNLMPPWKTSLSPDEMWQVLTYLSTLGK